MQCANGTKYLTIPQTSNVQYWAFYPNGSYSEYYFDGTSQFFRYSPNSTQISLAIWSSNYMGTPQQAYYWTPNYYAELSPQLGQSGPFTFQGFYYQNQTWIFGFSTPLAYYYLQVVY